MNEKTRGFGRRDDPLTFEVIGAAIEVHRELGPGLLESAYQACLLWELRNRSLSVIDQVALPVRYKQIELDCSYRMDLVVEQELVVELKTVVSLEPIHEAQLLSYLKLGGYSKGLLINFHVPRLVDGVKRLSL
jgi:GxxExxY protein